MHESPLRRLPVPLLELILQAAVETNAQGNSVRAVCSWLRDTHDALNTRLSLGGKEQSPYTLPPVAWPAVEPAPGLTLHLCSLVSADRSPCILHLAIRPQLAWIPWADALNSGGPALFQRLSSLVLRGRQDVQQLQALATCGSLTHLDLSNCSGVSDLRPLASCSRLVHLQLNNCQMLADLSPLANLSASLEVLELNGCTTLAELQPLSSLTKLRVIQLSECGWVSDLQPLSRCVNLEKLSLHDCADVRCLQPLSGCTALSDLNINHCRNVSSLQPLSTCVSLCFLDCGLCSCIDDLQPLASCGQLERLALCNTRVADLSPLASCPRLAHLQLSGCMMVSELQPLSSCTMLRHLDLRACSHVRDLAPVASVRRVLYQEPTQRSNTDLRSGSRSGSSSGLWSSEESMPGYRRMREHKALRRMLKEGAGKEGVPTRVEDRRAILAKLRAQKRMRIPSSSSSSSEGDSDCENS